MPRYTVIPSQYWLHRSGRTASLYGAAPWTSDFDRRDWSLAERGWTVQDTRTGTVGIGRKPWDTHAEAQAWADAH